MATTSSSTSSSASQKLISRTQMDRMIKVDIPYSHKLLFPYASVMERGSSYPHVLSHLLIFFIFVQSLGISIWLQRIDTNSNLSTKNQDLNYDLQKYLSLALLFTPITDDSTYIPVLACFSAIGILLFLIYMIPMLIFSKTHRVVRLLLPIQSCIEDILSPILVIPLFANFGIGIAQTYKNSQLDNPNVSTTDCAILLVFSAVAVILNTCLSSIAFMFTSNTVYFPNSEYVLTSHQIVLTCLIGQGVCAMFSYVSEVLGSTIEIADLVLHILFSISMCVLGIWQAPFLFSWVNYAFSAVAAAATINDIASRFVDLIYIRIAIFVVCTIVFTIIFKFVFDFYAKRVLNKFFNTVAPNQQSNLPQNQQQLLPGTAAEVLQKTNVRLLIQFCITYDDESFLSGMLFDKLIPMIRSPSDRLQVAKFGCFFPEFQAIFTTQIALLRNVTDLSFSQSFLYYQLCITETGRQPLSSVDELLSLRQESMQISTSMRASWAQLNSDISYFTFEKLSYDISLSRNHWEEAIEKYPKNALIAENYARHILEVEGDFEKCAEWHYRALQLQNGKVFDYDNATIHFLRLFPKFAKRLMSTLQLVDTDELDFKKSEELLETMVKQPKLHLEYQKAIRHYSNNCLSLMLIIALLKCAVLIIFWIVMLVSFSGTFSTRKNHMQFVYDVTTISEDVLLSNIAINFQGAKEITWMPTIDQINQILTVDQNLVVDDHYLINMSFPYFNTSAFYAQAGIESLDNLIQDLTDQSATDRDLGLVIGKFTERDLNLTVVTPAGIKLSIPGDSFRTLTSFYFASIISVANSPLPNEYFNPWVMGGTIVEVDNVCPEIIGSLKDVLETFVENDKKDVSDDKHKHMLIETITASIGFVIFVIAYLIVYICMTQQYTKVIQICRQLKEDAIRQASSSLANNLDSTSLDADQKSTTVALTTVNHKSYVSLAVFIIELILTLFAIVGVIVFYLQIVENHNKFTSMNELLLQSCLRSSFSLKIFTDFMRANMVQCSSPDITLADNVAQFESTISEFTNAHEACLRGDYGNGDVYKKVEKIRKESPCSSEITSQMETKHDNYACIPLDSAVSNFIELVKEMKDDICTPGYFKQSGFITNFHFVNSHMYDQLFEINNLLIELAEEESNNFETLVTGLGICFMVVALICLFVSLLNFQLIYQAHKTLIMFLLRLPPIDAVNNTPLSDLLLGRKVSKKNAKMSLSQKIVNDSSFPILFLNHAQIIENVNQSFVVDYGYDLSQIVGQNVTMMTDNPDLIHSKLTKIGKLAIRENVFEINFKKENKQIVKVELTVIPIFSNADIFQYRTAEDGQTNSARTQNEIDLLNNEEIKLKYFGLILRDLSTLISKNNQYEELKESNNNLLSKMISPVYMGNKQVYFDQAIVMYVKLVYYGGSMTPALFMQQRQLIFSKFNEYIEKRPLLTRIAINNGEYIILGSTLQQSMQITNYFNAKNNIKMKLNAIKSGIDPNAAEGDNAKLKPTSSNENVSEQAITDPARQCIDFALEASALFDDPAFFGDYIIGIDSGDVSLFMTGSNRTQNVITGSAMKAAQKMMMISNSGEISVSEKVYRSIATMDLHFTKMTDKDVGTYYIVNLTNDNPIEGFHEEPHP